MQIELFWQDVETVREPNDHRMDKDPAKKWKVQLLHKVLKPHYTEEDNEELLHRQPNRLQNARSHKILKYYDNSVSSSKCVQYITIFDLDLKTNIKSISYSE
jgi:hypothetical protein